MSDLEACLYVNFTDRTPSLAVATVSYTLKKGENVTCKICDLFRETKLLGYIQFTPPSVGTELSCTTSRPGEV